jgi:LacI family gluconate utilization system Gnt-I transcriptional repressor
MVEVVAAPATQQAGREALGRMLESHDFDVIVCSSDELAIGVLTEAHQRGLNTPADLAVMGYGDLAAASQTAPALSTVRVNGATIGTRAAEMLIERLQHGAQTGVATVLDTGFEIIERQSS